MRRQNGFAPYAGSAGDCFWLGAAGTSFWNDPAEDLVVVYMRQAPIQLFHYSELVRNMVYAALIQPWK